MGFSGNKRQNKCRGRSGKTNKFIDLIPMLLLKQSERFQTAWQKSYSYQTKWVDKK